MTLEVAKMVVVDGRDVQVLAAGEVAGLLGVSRQRVYQLMDQYEGTFPLPLTRSSEGALWRKKEVEEWERSWDRRWDPFRGRASSQLPGELVITLAGGDYVKVDGQLVAPSVPGVQLPDRLIPWSDITQIRRLRDADEPWQLAMQRTLFGVEIRAQISVALYPAMAGVPEQIQAQAQAVLQTSVRPSWVFREP